MSGRFNRARVNIIVIGVSTIFSYCYPGLPRLRLQQCDIRLSSRNPSLPIFEAYRWISPGLVMDRYSTEIWTSLVIPEPPATWNSPKITNFNKSYQRLTKRVNHKKYKRTKFIYFETSNFIFQSNLNDLNFRVALY